MFDDIEPRGPNRESAASRPRSRDEMPSDLPARPDATTEALAGAIVASFSMRRLVTTALRVATTNLPVLITGESGTGKEILARVIHQNSSRSTKPLIDINCAALPEHLVESELFGYEKGAFSGAETAKTGLFEAARGGTLFLDEIGELDRRVQSKLLRVLDGQPYFRLGGTKKVAADARIIAATNLDLECATKDGRFRSDLFHRLNAFHLRIPPLRERVEDIAPLADFFLQESGLWLSPEALSLMEAYPWPGNVRELKNVLNRAALFCAGSQVTGQDLPAEIMLGSRKPLSEECSLNDLEQRTIYRVLAQTGGHQQKAADLLGISRRTLLRKLKQYRGPAVHPELKSIA